MANQEHLDILKQGVEVWNQWRMNQESGLVPDLTVANLTRADLTTTDLSFTNFNQAVLDQYH